MKKFTVLLIGLVLLCSTVKTEAQTVTTDIVEQYLKFVTFEKKSVIYEATIEYNDSTKTFVKLGNRVTSYDVEIPEFSISLKSPEILGLRVESGTVWVGSSPIGFNDVNSLDIHRETWRDGDGVIISDVIYSESPTVADVLIEGNVDDDTREFIDAMVKFVEKKNN